jgi:hypothetical protein
MYIRIKHKSGVATAADIQVRKMDTVQLVRVVFRT